MSTLTIRTQNKCNTTTIENHFIDIFMPHANGEFVKIYLYLIRIMNDPNCGVTLAKIADTLEHTEKDILRAFNYWERQGLLTMSWDKNQNITAIDIVPATSAVPQAPSTMIMSDSCPSVEDISPTTVLPTISALEETIVAKTTDNPIVPAVIPVELNNYKTRKELEHVIFVTQTYLNKMLSKSELDTLYYFYENLNFSADLIEYLIEYCADNGHKSMHYIKAVANNWSQEGINTVDGAKAQVITNHKSYYIILRSFGITGRAPIQTEIQLMDKWMNEFGFSFELINEACSKTIATIQKPSFAYTDSILTKWKQQNVHYLTDVTKLDDAYKSNTKTTNKTMASKNTKPTTNNFEQRTYDINMIEQQLLGAQ